MMPTTAFPPRCAVSIVCGANLVSQVYPAAVPVEAFVDDALELLDADLRRHGASGLDSSVRYEFQRTNGTRLDITKSLADLGVDDGTTLVLAPEGDGDSFEPQIEALSTSLASVGRRLFPPVTAQTAVGCATAILAMTTATVLALALWARYHADARSAGVSTMLIGGMLAGMAVAMHRWFPSNRGLLDGFAWLAVPAVAGGIAMAVPGRLGFAHGFIACLAGAVSAALVTGLTRRHFVPGSAACALSLLGALIAGAQLWLGLAPQRLGILGLLSLLILVTASPTVALWVARIRPPHFGSITGRDIFSRADGMPVDAVAPVDADGGDDGADTTPAAAEVTAAALRANGVLRGLCIAVALGSPVAAWVTVAHGGPHPGAAVVLVGMFAAILLSRARAFGDRRQAVALVLGTSAMICAAAIRHVADATGASPAAFLRSAMGLTTFAAAAMAAALLVPATKFTPLVRMLAEWIELAMVVIALPLAAWMSGLFTWVRMR